MYAYITTRLFKVITLLATITLLSSTTSLAAPPVNEWAPQAKIPVYEDEVIAPVLIADQNHTVHAFNWQTLDDQPVIMYRTWSLENGWSDPIDVILPPLDNQQLARNLSLDVVLDDTGIVHLVFIAGDLVQADVYYTHAWLANAGQARSWSPPVVIGPQASIDAAMVKLADNGNGELLLVYSGNRDGNGLYATYSEDGGQNWQDPASLFITYDNEIMPYGLSLKRLAQGKVYAVWGTVNLESISDAVYFSKTKDDKVTWNVPTVLSPAIGYYGATPNIAETNGELLVTYHDDLPTTSWFRRSNDDGYTWSDPVKFAPGFVGSNGAVSYVMDSANTLHALFGNRNGETHGMWHRIWAGDRWGDVESVVSGPQIRDKTGGQGFDPNGAKSVISMGNVLLVTWITDGIAGPNGAWFSYKILDTPELTAEPLPVPSPVPTVTPTFTPDVTTTLKSTLPTKQSNWSDQDTSINLDTVNPAKPISFGVFPAIVLIILVVAFYRFFQSS